MINSLHIKLFLIAVLEELLLMFKRKSKGRYPWVFPSYLCSFSFLLSLTGLCRPSNCFDRSSLQSSVFKTNDVRAPLWMLPSAQSLLWCRQLVQFLPQQKAELALQWFGDIFGLSVHAHFASLGGQVSSWWVKNTVQPFFVSHWLFSDANTHSSSMV